MTDTRDTALVTGASGGIGEAIARRLAAENHDLVLVARSADKLADLAEQLRRQHGITVDTISSDLAVPGAAAALVAQLGDRRIDVLVNNAGVGLYGPLLDASPEALTGMLQLNMVSLTDLTRRLVPKMAERGRGHVLQVASTAAFMPGPLMAGYYASKAYVLSLTEALADEWRGTGVTVTALCPGPIATGFQAGADMGDSKLVKGKKLMTADECAAYAVTAMHAGKVVAIPGLMNRIQAFTPRLLPRRLVPGFVRRAQAPSH
jgi:short-subunit dehydrogenase